MPTPGADCHITLAHPLVNAGDPYGFILDQERPTRPGGIAIKRQIASDGSQRVWVYFDILLADDLLNPNGSRHTKSRGEMYARWLEYMAQPGGLALGSALGVLLNLGALGWTAEERHIPDRSLLLCQLNNAGVYWPPVDPILLANSVWDGTLTWASSYWR